MHANESSLQSHRKIFAIHQNTEKYLLSGKPQNNKLKNSFNEMRLALYLAKEHMWLSLARLPPTDKLLHELI